jgi:hypothetical protein
MDLSGPVIDVKLKEKKEKNSAVISLGYISSSQQI